MTIKEICEVAIKTMGNVDMPSNLDIFPADEFAKALNKIKGPEIIDYDHDGLPIYKGEL